MSLDLEKEGRLREEINMLKNADKTMDKIVALCKNRGFIFAGSEIYGGLANTWDYGPLGVELKNNVKKAWWKKFVQESPYNVGQDAAILMNPQVWVASGHVTTFNDPLIDCKACKMRHRADQLIENYNAANGIEGVQVEAMDQDSLVAYIREKKIPCPGCGMTRAHLAALRLDFPSAFFYHPLWFLPIPLAAVQLFFPRGIFRERKWNNALAVLLLILLNRGSVPASLRSGWLSNSVLMLCLVLFTVLAGVQVVETVRGLMAV